MAIQVFLVSDHQLITWALTHLLESAAKRYRLVGTAGAVDPVSLRAMVAGAPDIVLLDMDSEPERLMEAITAVHAAVPSAKPLLLTRLSDTGLQDRAVINGARGVLDRNATPEQILTALAKVQEGQVWLDRVATGRVFVELSRIGTRKPAASAAADKVASLTEREQEILAFITQNSGEPGKALAAKLRISESTLRNHLTSIYDKLGVANRNGLLAYAYQTGLAKRLVAGSEHYSVS